jgi:hypothetical protein
MTTITTKAPSTGAGQQHLNETLASVSHSATSKDEYRAFCRQERSLHLFARDWWLDAAVGPDGWDVALVKQEASIVAAMPYVLRRRYGMKIVTQPALTPVLGPWLRQLEGKPAARLSTEKEYMQALIDQLPPFDHFAQTWHPGIENWQPFFWKGFRQTTYYTYILPDLSDVDRLWAGLDGKVRRAIARAEKECRLQVRDDLPLAVLLALSRKTFERQGMRPPYSDEFVSRLDAACRERNCSRLLVAVDPDGVPYAGYYFVWDEHSAYGLVGGADPAYRHSAASTYCLWATIRNASGLTRQYNFAGSMIEPVEAFLRSFGGRHVPYFHVSKTPSRLLTMRQGMRSLMGRH